MYFKYIPPKTSPKKQTLDSVNGMIAQSKTHLPITDGRITSRIGG